jgi:hypothetical protein
MRVFCCKDAGAKSIANTITITNAFRDASRSVCSGKG